MRLRRLLDPCFLPDVEVLSQLLDDMSTGVAVVDDEGQLIFANAAALDLIAAGEPLVEREGTLLASNSEQEFAMRRVIARAARAESGCNHSVSLPRASGRPLQVVAAPLSTHRERSLVTLFIGDDAGNWCG